MVVGYARCICATIKGVGKSIWTLFNRMWLMVVGFEGVGPCQPLKGYPPRNVRLDFRFDDPGPFLVKIFSKPADSGQCRLEEFTPLLYTPPYCTALRGWT